MKKYTIIFLIISLVTITSIVKKSTRELETKIFNSKEKIKIFENKKSILMLQNNYLSSPERLFKLKEELFGEDLEVLEIKNFKYFSYNEKK
tara:strand:+ start:231 stop:503 length:273 start_codon:yes stop_codon:yes gene_type:complete